MDESFWMSQAQRRLVDASSLYNHRARLLADDFGEVRHRWSDRRGQSYSGRHIEPQLVSIGEAQALLRQHLTAADGAISAAMTAEDKERQCRAALTECEQDAAETRRLTRASLEISGRVVVEAGDIAGAANAIDARVAVLLA